jgi:hypothetical protein
MDERSMDQLRRLPDEELGRAVAEAAGTSFPRTPDIASVVKARLEREALAYPDVHRRRQPARSSCPRLGWIHVRRSTALALLAIVVLAAIAAAVILGVPGVRFTFQPALPSLPPTPSATSGPSGAAAPGTQAGSHSPLSVRSPAASAIGAGLFLGLAVDLDSAQSQLPFPIRAPRDPLLGEPDQVYLQQTRNGRAVTLVWGPRPGLPTGPTGVAALLTEFEGAINPDQFQKVIGPGTTVTPAKIGDARGYWLHGAEHFFVSPTATSGDWDEQRVRLAGDTLLWNVDSVTYRLEAAVSQPVAIRVAESLAP